MHLVSCSLCRLCHFIEKIWAGVDRDVNRAPSESLWEFEIAGDLDQHCASWTPEQRVFINEPGKTNTAGSDRRKGGCMTTGHIGGQNSHPRVAENVSGCREPHHPSGQIPVARSVKDRYMVAHQTSYLLY
jgi:hypothetical protein